MSRHNLVSAQNHAEVMAGVGQGEVPWEAHPKGESSMVLPGLDDFSQNQVGRFNSKMDLDNTLLKAKSFSNYLSTCVAS